MRGRHGIRAAAFARTLARAMRINAERPAANAVEILEYNDYMRLPV
jgi:hypothetical protein